MKKITILVLSALLLLAGCGKDKKDSKLYNSILSVTNPMGVISCYSGKVGNSSSAIPLNSFRSLYQPWPTDEVYFYIKSIEISTTGEQWIKIVEDPIEVKVKNGGKIKIGSSVYVPPDEYHGIRLVIEPKIRFYTVYNGAYTTDAIVIVNKTLEKLPREMALGNKPITPTTTIVFSSANGYLVPFDVENGKETFLVFDFWNFWLGDSPNNITDWVLYLSVRGTRYLY